MGWKKFQNHYGIEHIVHICEGKLCIGSEFIPRIIEIDLKTGLIDTRSERAMQLLNTQYPHLLKSKPETILKMIAAQDQFDRHLPIYAIEGDDVVEKFVEDYEYLSVTHDGSLVYENTFFRSHEQAKEKLMRSLQNRIQHCNQRLNEIKNELIEEETLLKRYINRHASLMGFEEAGS